MERFLRADFQASICRGYAFDDGFRRNDHNLCAASWDAPTLVRNLANCGSRPWGPFGEGLRNMQHQHRNGCGREMERAEGHRSQARHDEGRATRALAAPRDDVEIRFVRHSASLMAALGYAGVDPADPAILPLLRQAASTCAKLFELAPSDFASGIGWLDGFFSGLVARDGESLEALAGVPLDRVRASGVGVDECVYGLIDGLQHVWRGALGTEDVLVAAMKATDPCAVRVGPVDLVLKVRVPLHRVNPETVHRTARGALLGALRARAPAFAPCLRALPPACLQAENHLLRRRGSGSA